MLRALLQHWFFSFVGRDTNWLQRWLVGWHTELLYDAWRWRWLRAQSWDKKTLAVTAVENIPPGTDCPSGDRLDTIIDYYRNIDKVVERRTEQ